MYTSSCIHLRSLSYCFFFFKQKTAYEMRISDWSSDVCSSDLTRPSDKCPPPLPAKWQSNAATNKRQLHRPARTTKRLPNPPQENNAMHAATIADRKSVV